MKLGVTVHTCNPSTWEMEVGGSVQGQSQLSETPISKNKLDVYWVLLADMIKIRNLSYRFWRGFYTWLLP